MNDIIIEPHYLGSLEYYSLLIQYDHIYLEVHDAYRKQTFRNRCYLLTANGVQSLSVPVKFSSDSITKDVRIDHQQRWKAPFFDYFAESFEVIWEKRHVFLIDLAFDFLALSFKLLDRDVTLSYSEKNNLELTEDFRNQIIPKNPFTSRKTYLPARYTQLFGDTFVPNLSIVDLIMCKGPQASHVLAASFLGEEI